MVDFPDASSWTLVFGDESTRGVVRLALTADRAHWWSYLLTEHAPLVVVHDDDVPRPRQGLEIRTEGLWGEFVCETAGEHWSFGMEAFGLAFDDPLVVSEFGDRIPVGFDLEWEAAGDRIGDGGRDTARGWYATGGIAHGEVLIGQARVEVDGVGARIRTWGDGCGIGTGLEITSDGVTTHDTSADASPDFAIATSPPTLVELASLTRTYSGLATQVHDGGARG